MKKLLIALALCFILSSPVYAWVAIDTFNWNAGVSTQTINLWREGVDYSEVTHFYLEITGTTGIGYDTAYACLRFGPTFMHRWRWGNPSYAIPKGLSCYSGADNGGVVYSAEPNPDGGRLALIGKYLAADVNLISANEFYINSYPGNYEKFFSVNFVDSIHTPGWARLEVRYTSGFITLAKVTELEYTDYCINFESFNETLVQDNTWLHDIFYEKFAWQDAWRYNTTVRTEDKNGEFVEGWLYPITSDINGIEVLGLQWPLRQFKTFHYPV